MNPDLARLAKAQEDIDNALTEGRMSQKEYEYLRRKIDQAVQDINDPAGVVRSGGLRVRAVRHKEFDTEAYARALFMIAEDEVRKKKGKPPLTAEQQRYREALHFQAQAIVEAKRRAQSPEPRPDEPSDPSDPKAAPGNPQP